MKLELRCFVVLFCFFNVLVHYSSCQSWSVLTGAGNVKEQKRRLRSKIFCFCLISCCRPEGINFYSYDDFYESSLQMPEFSFYVDYLGQIFIKF